MGEPSRSTPPAREPLVYFGRWCGPGWSAAREGGASISGAEAATGGVLIKGATGKLRESPVDLACKLHDMRYEQISRLRDPLAAAQMTLAADRELFRSVSRLVSAQTSGRNDLTLGEVLYAKNVRIAFGTKRVKDNLIVADQLRRRLERNIDDRAAMALRQATPYAIFLGLSMSGMPIIARLSRTGK